MMGDDLPHPGELPLLTGEEPLVAGATVRDFWAWALGDLRLNANRGMLAQFLVARAVGDPRPRNDGWGDYDVESPDGIRIEVKSSGYLQSWRQQRPSRITFSGLKALRWDDATGYGERPEFRADVYVFAIHGCTDPVAYDPLDLSAWSFRVLPASVLRVLDQRSISLWRLETLAPDAVAWDGLAAAIRAAAGLDAMSAQSDPASDAGQR